jgi:uncharacterized repeat protein (TIGR01451 family)
MTPQLSLNFSSEDTHLPEDIGLYIQSYFVTGSNSINLSAIGTGILYYTLEVIQIIRPNPTVTIPAIITVAPNENFVIPVRFNAFSSALNLEDVWIKCRNVDNALQTSGSLMQIFIDQVLVGETVNLTFKSPNTLGFYTIKTIKVQGFFTLQNAVDSSDRKIFRQEIGPIIINVTNQPHSADDQNTIVTNPLSTSLAILTPHSASSDLSLSKSVTIPSTYKQGDVIDVTISLTNTGDKRQYYALEDMLPSGTTYVDGSLEISGTDTYTIDDSAGEINLFFNTVPVGEIRVHYQVQTQAVKNVYLGTCVLWSMYDNVTLTALSDLLEPIPMLYSPDQILYRDDILPTINIDDYTQIDGETPTIKVSWEAQDNAPLGKIRFVFRQSSGWRSQSEYLATDGGEFNSILSDLENVDGELVFFVEVTDIYGNLIISPIYRLSIRSTLIPTVTVIIIGLIAILVAGVVSIYTRRRYSRVLNSQRTLPYTGFVDPRDNPI